MSDKKPREWKVFIDSGGNLRSDIEAVGGKPWKSIHVREVLPEAEPEFPEKDFDRWYLTCETKPTHDDCALWAWDRRGKASK